MRIALVPVALVTRTLRLDADIYIGDQAERAIDAAQRALTRARRRLRNARLALKRRDRERSRLGINTGLAGER